MRRSFKFIVAVVVVALLGVFLLRNLDHQAQLCLIRDFEVNTLVLLLIGFFAGAASVFLMDMRKHCREDRRRTGPTKARNAVSDEDL